MDATNAHTEAANFLNEAKQSVDLAFSSCVVLPGDDVSHIVTRLTKKLKLGAGLRERDSKVIVCKPGILRYRPPNRYWVDYSYKRYVASIGDSVIGIVEDRNADFYRLNIGSTNSATLPLLSFDGASKRNRPNLQSGSVVYTRIVNTKEYSEPEVTCEAPSNSVKKEWMTGQCIYGELHDGYVFKCSISHLKRLLKTDCVILKAIGEFIPFEIAVGMNGIAWVNASSVRQIILVSNAILNSESLSDAQAKSMIKQLMNRSKDNYDDESE